MIRVLIADDDDNVRTALAELIDSQTGMKLVAAVENAQQALAETIRTRPDVALLDVRMPGGGVAAARDINREAPQTKVLALSGERERQTVLEMLEGGAVGYLTKGSALETIIESIVAAAAGYASLSADITGQVIKEAVEEHGSRRLERQRAELKRKRIEGVLANGAFDLVFQPIFELASRHPIGLEALSRFRALPRRPPDVWFAEAAEVDLGAELELSAAGRAFDSLPFLLSSQYLAVNLSPGSLLMPRLRALLDRVEPSRIVVEVTEHAQIANYARLAGSLGGLRASGLRLAVDDAGAGFASLRHILMLAPDIIKLDRTLISRIDEDRSKQALAAGLTSFATGIGAAIVAEGIERPEEIEVLHSLGVQYGQGYFLGRPQALGPVNFAVVS